jgi:hypothetical protein
MALPYQSEPENPCPEALSRLSLVSGGNTGGSSSGSAQALAW